MPEICAARSSYARRCAGSCSRTPGSRSTPTAEFSVLDARRRAGAGRASFLRSRERAAPGGRGDGRSARADRDRGARGDGRRLVEPAQGLPGLGLRVGVHRHREEPFAPVVLDGLVWQPREGARLPPAPPALISTSAHGHVRVGGRAAELVVVPLRHVRARDVRVVDPEVRHPRHDLGRQGLVEALVAGARWPIRRARRSGRAVRRRSGCRGCRPSRRAPSPVTASARRASS